MTSEQSVLTTPHPAYVRHPLHCRWHHIHSITPNHSIYDVTSTSGMISQPLYQTLHTLYLSHHTLSADITPRSEWPQTHLLCDIICTIYNITSNLYVITLLYLWHHNLYIWNHIQYVGQNIHYTGDITATICVLTPTVYTTSHQLILWHHTLHMCGIVCIIQHIIASLLDFKPTFWEHHTHYIRHHAHCICVITCTVLMISHKLYFWDHICHISRHHIPCIRHDSNCMPSNHFIHDTRFPIYDITSRDYDMSSPYMWQHSHYVLWIHVNYI